MTLIESGIKHKYNWPICAGYLMKLLQSLSSYRVVLHILQDFFCHFLNSSKYIIHVKGMDNFQKQEIINGNLSNSGKFFISNMIRLFVFLIIAVILIQLYTITKFFVRISHFQLVQSYHYGIHQKNWYFREIKKVKKKTFGGSVI